MISQTPFIVVDLETTGLEPNLDRIIEIGAVKVLNGEIVDEWGTLVNPGIFVPDVVTNITGITTEMLQDAPSFDDVKEEYLSFFDDNAIFVAHNVDFDRDFLNSHLTQHSSKPMVGPYMCTFKLAKQVHPNLSKYSLGSLAELFDVDLQQAHRAVHDARATAELMLKFLKVLQDGGLKRVKDIPVIQNLPKIKEEISDGQASLF
jgi:DNA polymerase III epsilon subunit family exonuclease